MSKDGRRFFNSQGESRTLSEIGPDQGRKRSRDGQESPQGERQDVRRSPRETNVPRRPRPLSFSVFIDGKPMTEEHNIMRDAMVAAEFGKQIFPDDVITTVKGASDVELFSRGVQSALLGTAAQVESGARLKLLRQQIKLKDQDIAKLKKRVEEAENRATNNARRLIEADKIIAELSTKVDVPQRLMTKVADQKDADLEHVKANIRADASAQGQREGWKLGYAKGRDVGIAEGKKTGEAETIDMLADQLGLCENRGFKFGWIAGLRAAGVKAGSPLEQQHELPFEAFGIEPAESGPDLYKKFS